MNKRELVDAVAQGADLSKSGAGSAVDAVALMGPLPAQAAVGGPPPTAPGQLVWEEAVMAAADWGERFTRSAAALGIEATTAGAEGSALRSKG